MLQMLSSFCCMRLHQPLLNLTSDRLSHFNLSLASSFLPFSALKLRLIPSGVSDIDAMNSSNEAHDAARTQVLSSILNEIGSSECFTAIVEDYVDDGALETLSKLRPERVASKIGMSLDKAIAFVNKCREASVCRGTTSRGAAMSSSSPPPSTSAPFVWPASPADDAAIMRALNLDVIRELGKGGFGTVYEAKNLADRLKVAVKIVKDPQNAIQAIREGQRLRRVV
jgi:hypothetical protein